MKETQMGGKDGRVTLLVREVATRISAKESLVDEILAALARDEWICGDDQLRVRMALDEAITNAMLHGNRMDARKVVRIEVFAERERWGILIEDEGEGFGKEELPDPEDPANLLREGGRGVMMMKGFMDDVRFLGRGNQVQMTRRRTPLA